MDLLQTADQLNFIIAFIMTVGYVLIPSLDAYFATSLHKNYVGDYSSRLAKLSRSKRVIDFLFYNTVLWLVVFLLLGSETHGLGHIYILLAPFHSVLLLCFVYWLGTMYMSLVDDYRSLKANLALIKSDDLPKLEKLTTFVEQEMSHKKKQIERSVGSKDSEI